ncbi:snaclec agglucetin subunit beta-1-like [Lytechinus variegatus]|uniref:snaclec agglucetin subunit beta-1-like n=1 Tax=Lytechinus variegatus TaxID=7654 RepID=UPI001BB1B960|nr:snaclec agglucetin subunit beta-1-like [Lytechinus variegatus]
MMIMKGFCRDADFVKSLFAAITTSVWVLLSILCLFTIQGNAQICNTPEWLVYENKEYLFAHYDDSTYDYALFYCQSQGAHLPVVTSHQQNAFLNTFTNKLSVFTYWIGLNDMDNDGIFTWVNNVDLQESGYTNFVSLPQQGNCIKISPNHSGQWFDSDCASQSSFICQRPADSRCSWHQLGQYFYRFMGELTTFDEAETKCINLGGRLAIISSSEINMFLTEVVSPALSTAHCYWFGLSQSSDSDQFTWSDGTQLRRV